MALLNPNPANTITCSSITDQSTLKSLKFQNAGWAIIQGANTLLEMALNSFFVPVNKYQYSEFEVPASGSVTIDPGNISNGNGEVTGIFMVIEYPDKNTSSTNLTEADKYIEYTYYNDDTMNIGKLLVLTGSSAANKGWNLLGSPGVMVVTNPHDDFDVSVKLLLVS